MHGATIKIKLTQLRRKFKIIEISIYNKFWGIYIDRQTDRQTERMPQLIMKYQENGTKDDPSKNFRAVNGTGRGHEI
jgi:hypothetical protein